MFLNNRTTGASCKNTVDIIATSISLYDANGNGHYTDINDVFVNQDQVIVAEPNEKGIFEFPDDQVNDNNVSGLQSMIEYIKTHSRQKPNITYEDNSLTIVKKRVNASKKSFLYEDNQTINKINKTINKINKQFVVDDSSHYTIKKNHNKIIKQYFHDDNLVLHKINNTTNNNSFKNYHTVTLQDNHNFIEQTNVNNRTTKIIPNYIHQDHYHYLAKSSDAYSKSYIDDWISNMQSIIDILSSRILTLENEYATLTNQNNPGSLY